jgi:hypothetical protein
MVSPTEDLLRHVHPNTWDTENDRPMAGVFKDRELSVDREALRSVEEAAKRRPKHGFARFSTQRALDLKQLVVAKPVGQPVLEMDGIGPPTEDHNPAHAEVVGAKPRSVRVALRDACTVALRPDGHRT